MYKTSGTMLLTSIGAHTTPGVRGLNASARAIRFGRNARYGQDYILRLDRLVDGCHQRYFAASATTTPAAITNMIICAQRLLAKPPGFLFSCIAMVFLP